MPDNGDLVSLPALVISVLRGPVAFMSNPLRCGMCHAVRAYSLFDTGVAVCQPCIEASKRTAARLTSGE